MRAPDIGPQTLARRAKIAELDQLSRTRPLTDDERWRLQQLLYRDRYSTLAADRREAQGRKVAA